MRRAVFHALLSHWRRQKWQLATLLIGIALATALWSGVQAINAEARAAYARAAEVLGQNQLSRVERADGAELRLADFAALRRAGWLVSPVFETRLTLGATRVRLLGVDPLTLPRPAFASLGASAGEALTADITRAPLLADPDTIRAIGPDPDLPDRIATPGMAPALVVTDLDTSHRLADRRDGITRLLLDPEQPLRQAPLDTLGPGYRIEAPEDGGDIARLTDSFHLNLTAFGFLSFVVGLLIVYAAIGLAFEQRRALFRTLRALGVPAATLLGAFAVELFGFALIGGLVGVVLGYMIAATLLPDVAATLSGLYGATVPGGLQLRPAWWLSGLAIAGLGTLLAGLSSLWTLRGLPILAAAQPRAWTMASDRRIRRLSWAGLGLLGLGGLVWVAGSGLLAGFAILGAIMLGLTVQLPSLLRAGLARAERISQRPVAGWFWADTRQQVPGLSMALMALLLALATNIGVSTMVGSFRETFTGWLDQRLVSELYLYGRDAEEAARIHSYLLAEGHTVLPIWHADTRIAGRPGEVYGIIDHATYRDNWPMLEAMPDVWDRLLSGDALLLNEQTARRQGISLGDSISLGPEINRAVAGIYSDYGNPEAQAIVALSVLNAAFPDADRRRFGLRIPPETTDAVMADLTNRFDLSADAMVDQARLKAFSLSVFERTFAVTAALNVLTLGVAGIAILTSLLTIANMRLPQLAPVWAAGLDWRRLAALELLRTGILALMTFAAALPLGLVLAWILLTVINVEAFGWRLPLHIFPGDWIALGLSGLIAALFAAALPAWRLARTPPDALVRIFAHER